MKKKDFIFISVLLLISLLLLIPVRAGEDTGEAYIYLKGDLYGRYDLSDDRILTIDNGSGLVNEIEIKEGSICMKSATCPGRQCVNTGSISRSGESICCAPAGILIRIQSGEETGYDAITN